MKKILTMTLVTVMLIAMVLATASCASKVKCNDCGKEIDANEAEFVEVNGEKLNLCKDCAENPTLIGEWVANVEGMEMSFVLNKDGTGKMGAMGVNFETTYKVVDGDTVEITMNIMGEKETTEFTYKIEGDKPSLTADGETLVFTKK